MLRDGDGLVLLVWFNQVQYFARRFAKGQRLVVHGRVEVPLGGGPRRLVHPDVSVLEADEDAAAQAQIVPIYEKPTAMPVGVMRRIVQGAVGEHAATVPSVLPAEVAARQRLVDVGRALRHVHTPAPEADLAALAAGSLAHRSLIFDELFYLQLGLALRRSAAGQEPVVAISQRTLSERPICDAGEAPLAPSPPPPRLARRFGQPHFSHTGSGGPRYWQ